MNNNSISYFAESSLVWALLSTFKAEEITRENWPQIEAETVSRISELLAVDAKKATEIFRNGMIALLTANKQAV